MTKDEVIKELASLARQSEEAEVFRAAIDLLTTAQNR
jgi:hypothetical protein